MDSECATGLACFNGKCLNPCLETEPCGINAECVVTDTLPLRTMSCVCRAGFIGDAESECRRGNVRSLVTSLQQMHFSKFILQVLFQVNVVAILCKIVSVFLSFFTSVLMLKMYTMYIFYTCLQRNFRWQYILR